MIWRRIGGGAAIVAAIVAGAGFALARIADAPSAGSETPTLDRPVTADAIERGRYLTAAGNCAGCHTRPGGAAFAGGLAMKLPIGTIFTSNITPDRATGIGAWSDADFIAAMYRGISRDGHHLYPAFPYTSYTRMPIDDVLAIKAFLSRQKAVAAKVPRNAVSFPFNQTWGIAYWNLLFNAKARFAPVPGRSALVNRGAYLVEGPGHCGGCHTPRGISYAENAGAALGGGVADGVKAYNLTADPVWGIGAWSTNDLVRYMADGRADGHGAAGASMAQVVEQSLSRLSQNDLLAIASYLKQTPPVVGGAQVRRDPPGARGGGLEGRADEPQGRAIYAGACAGCHGWGGPAPAVGATLAGHRSANDPAGTNAVAVTLHGSRLTTPRGSVAMPAFKQAYSDAEIAAVTRFVVAGFGGGGAKITGADVRRARER